VIKNKTIPENVGITSVKYQSRRNVFFYSPKKQKSFTCCCSVSDIWQSVVWHAESCIFLLL